MKTLKAKWTGIRPLLMHNGAMVDHTNPLTQKIKSVVQKGGKNMQQPDYDLRDRLEWEAGLYWDEKLGPFIPCENIERCIRDGAQKNKLGKNVAAAVLCTETAIKVQYDGPRTKDEMYESGRFQFRCGIRIQQVRIIRVRPMIPTGWSVSFTIEFDDSIISQENVVKAMTDAGALIGLGDWRPKFGRFLCS